MTLAFVSTGALAMLLISLPMNELQLIMSTAAAISLQLCLYLFSRSHHKKLQIMAAVLLILSVMATTAFMESAWQQHIAIFEKELIESNNNSFAAQQQRQQISDITRQINLIMQSTEDDINNGYRQRSDNRLEQLDALYVQREALVQQLRIQPESHTRGAETGSFQALMTGLSREVRLCIFFVIAMLIDYTALLALGMVKPTESKVKHDDSVDWSTLLEERILSGVYGQTPSQRQMIDEIKSAFESLLDQGLLSKEDKRFKLIGGAETTSSSKKGNPLSNSKPPKTKPSPIERSEIRESGSQRKRLR
ncbi:hypothetical protein [Endozoicomonas ascidiicola]|uniref:hypothetical protein n=1 Tax=Endozoicomonas ascidiicola TaxID=1698521 RepID=UPI0012FDBEAF|nr:hypothetical protein [Endozoicomonas ascidiicola]